MSLNVETNEQSWLFVEVLNAQVLDPGKEAMKLQLSFTTRKKFQTEALI